MFLRCGPVFFGRRLPARSGCPQRRHSNQPASRLIRVLIHRWSDSVRPSIPRGRSPLVLTSIVAEIDWSSRRAIPTDASPAGWPFHPLPPAGENRKCNVFTPYAIHFLIVGGYVNFVPGTVMTLVCASATNPNNPSDRIIEIVSLKTLFCLFVIILQIIHQTYDPFICYFH